MAEVGQSKMKPEKHLWLTEVVKVDMVKFAFQTNKYNRFLKNSEKVGGCGLTMMKCTEYERAEEWCFVDQFCDLIENGNLLEEMEDPNDLAFMPLARAKHKAPAHDKGIQEKPNKGKKVPKGGKKLPNHSSQGFNPCYTEETTWTTQTKSQKKKDVIDIDNPDTEVMVPDDIEHDFVKANHVYYVVLSPCLEKSDKLITSCRGCNGKITLEEKRFPHNMVFGTDTTEKCHKAHWRTGHGLCLEIRRIATFMCMTWAAFTSCKSYKMLIYHRFTWIPSILEP